MPYPDIFDPDYSYTGFEQSQGDGSFPGTQLDNDLAGLHDSIVEVSEFTKHVVRADGALNNGIVTYDSLSASLQTAGIAEATAWQTGVIYAKNVAVIESGKLYRSTVEHVAGVFATDLTAGKWVFVAQVAGESATVEIGTVTTLAPGSPATVVNVGTESQVELNFGIPRGANGANGTNGTNGTNGVGVPTGGATGQVLAKSSNADYAAQWVNQSGGGGGTQPNNRLSLTTGVAVTTTDVAAATTVYLGAGSSFTSNGTSLVADNAAELSLVLDATSGHTGYHQSGKNFDVFRINDGGTIRIGTGPAWASDTSPGTGAGTTETQFLGSTGAEVNKNSITIRFGSASGNTVVVPALQALYIGSFRASADGQTSDTVLRRFLWNRYNAVDRTLFVNAEPLGTSWPYTIQTWRQVNANANNKVEILQGRAGAKIRIRATGTSLNTSPVASYVGIGVNSTTVNSASSGGYIGTVVANIAVQGDNEYEGYPRQGYSFYAWLEASAPTGACTHYSGDNTANFFSSGLSGGCYA